MELSFQEYCNELQKIAQTRGTNAKISLFSALLKRIETNREVELAVQFAAEGAFDALSGQRASVGSRTIGLAAASFCEIDYEIVFKACRTATGSSSETIERLMENLPLAVEKRNPGRYTLLQIPGLFEELRKISSRDEKISLLHHTWTGMSGTEIKFFIRMLSQGSLRIGFESRSVLTAISRTWSRDPEQVRYVHMITGTIGKTALMAKEDSLNQARFSLFHPLTFMLASPIDLETTDSLSNYLAEEKFDGMRAQLHANGQKIRLFSRDLNDITTSFPDLVSAYAAKELPSIVLDGEICVYREQKIQPFQHLQKRMGVKKPGKKILADYPVLFIAYDLLFAGDTPLFGQSLTHRRKALETVASRYTIPVTRQFRVQNRDELEEAFLRALQNGNEGLMLKLDSSRYEYGQRKKSWLKVKKPGGSIDTVMMYAHAGSGRRGGTYSDFTLGVRVKEDERYEEEFIPIGKAYGGYSDEELRKMNRRIRELTVDKFGPTLSLIPGLVVEIEFDGIQVNRRTKAGYTLRFPRFRRIRWDLGPEDVNTLKDVEELYREKEDRSGNHRNVDDSYFIPDSHSF